MGGWGSLCRRKWSLRGALVLLTYKREESMKFGALAAFVATALVTGRAWGADVGVIHIDGPIGPATATYISRAIQVAGEQKDECLIITLNTPGGLVDTTEKIVQSFYTSPVPTVVYVSPSGGNAWSAGTFITLAAD